MQRDDRAHRALVHECENRIDHTMRLGFAVRDDRPRCTHARPERGHRLRRLAFDRADDMTGPSELLEREEALPEGDVEHGNIQGLFAPVGRGASALPSRRRRRGRPG